MALPSSDSERTVVVRIGAVLTDQQTGELLVREATLPDGAVVVDARLPGVGSPADVAEALVRTAARYRTVHGLSGSVVLSAARYEAIEAEVRAAAVAVAASNGTAEVEAEPAAPAPAPAEPEPEAPAEAESSPNTPSAEADASSTEPEPAETRPARRAR